MVRVNLQLHDLQLQCQVVRDFRQASESRATHRAAFHSRRVMITLAPSNTSYHGQLPQDIVASIQRILNLQDEQEDSVDALVPTFNPVSTINTLFPDGAWLLRETCRWLTDFTS